MYTHDEIQKLEEDCITLESAIDDALSWLKRAEQSKSWLTVDEVIQGLEEARSRIHKVSK